MTVTAATRGYYDVTSERDETVSYMVMPGKSCTCPHHQCRGAYCKHLQAVDAYLSSQPEPTALQKATAIAETLPDADLRKWAAEKGGTAAACACLLELAKRQAARQPRPIPEGVLALLQGATEAERERALEIYK